mgnify:CR=1 FL=1
MKTATARQEKDERAAWLQRRRANHHKALETIARQVGCETNGLTLWRQLRRVENWLTPLSLRHCNGEGIDGDQWERFKGAAGRSPDPEADMSTVLRQLVRWYCREPGAKLPERPPADGGPW